MIYDPDIPCLENVRTHLVNVEGGYTPIPFQAFLLSELYNVKISSIHRSNILGFFAKQSLSSRAGDTIYSTGSSLIPEIISLGIKSPDYWSKRSFLTLAYGIHHGQELYKAFLDTDDSEDTVRLDQYLIHLRHGETNLVPFVEP